LSVRDGFASDKFRKVHYQSPVLSPIGLICVFDFSGADFPTEIRCLGSHNYESVYFRLYVFWPMELEVVFYLTSFVSIAPILHILIKVRRTPRY
jgi:hypothetical protein